MAERVYWHVTMEDGEREGGLGKAKQSQARSNKERVGKGLSPNSAYLHESC